MTSTNFIIANIKLLIEISDDGKYKIHEDRTHMDFNPCDELPPIRKNEDGENIMQNILRMVSSTNKIKWDNREGEDDISEYEEDQDQADNSQEEEDDDDTEDEDSDTSSIQKEDDPQIPRVYNHEINNEPKKTSLTTTLKNRVKNNISKKNRGT